MTAPSIGTIRQALAAAVDNTTITCGQQTRTLRAYGYLPTGDGLVPPFAFVAPADVDYDQSFGRGHDRMGFTITVVVDGDVRATDEILDSLQRGSTATSLKTSVEVDKTLGGVVSTLHVTGSRRVPPPENFNDCEAAEWAVVLYCPGV